MTSSSRVVIAGGSGFLGCSLARWLARDGRDVVIVSRRAPEESGPWRHVPWDARTVMADWKAQLEGAAGLVNLAGRTVDCIKTPDHCDEILRSRVEATRALGRAMVEIVRAGGAAPPVWVQMSTAHRYGDPPELVCDEDAAFGYGLAPFVGAAWEEAFEARWRKLSPRAALFGRLCFGPALCWGAGAALCHGWSGSRDGGLAGASGTAGRG